MQERIFEIKVHQADENVLLTKASASSLFYFHKLME